MTRIPEEQLREWRKTVEHEKSLGLTNIWTDVVAKLLAAPPMLPCEGVVKELTEADYRSIFDAARDAKRAFFKGYAPCDIPVQDDFGWWVMKETERRICAALRTGGNSNG